MRPALLREPDRGREHLLADRPELQRHEDALVGALLERVEVADCGQRRGRARGSLARRGARARRSTSPASSQIGPADARASCVTSASDPDANVSGAPTSASSGTGVPRPAHLRAAPGTGARGSGSVKRSRTTATCAAVNASSTPKLKRLARKRDRRRPRTKRRPGTPRRRPRRDDRDGRDQRPPVQPREGARAACRAGRASRRAGRRRRSTSSRRPTRTKAPSARRRRAATSTRAPGRSASSAVGDPHERRADPFVPERRSPAVGSSGSGRTGTPRCRRRRSRRRRRRPRRSRRRGCAAASCRARGSRPRGSRPSRARCRRASRAAARRRARSTWRLARVARRAEPVAREQEDAAEHDQQHCVANAKPAIHDREPVQTGPADEPHRRRSRGSRRRPTTLSQGLSREPVPADRVAEVVRREQRGERDHDQVVEEEHPAGQEPGLVVERAPDEESPRRPVSGIAAVPSAYESGDERKSSPTASSTHGRQAERVQRDDAEREVERGARSRRTRPRPAKGRRGRAGVRAACVPWLGRRLDSTR